ncbi:MAG: tetratricopeptide repeat protein [Roseivirga sp.]|nr:tetratricopeptide repeat protein [Roseivirga sp.]
MVNLSKQDESRFKASLTSNKKLTVYKLFKHTEMGDKRLKAYVKLFDEYYDKIDELDKESWTESIEQALVKPIKDKRTKVVFELLSHLAQSVEIHPGIIANQLYYEYLKNQSKEEAFTSIKSDLVSVHTWYSLKGLGDLCFDLDKLEESIEAYKESLKKKDYYKVHYNLANALSIVCEYELCIKHYSQADELRPNLDPVLYNWGFSLHQSNRYPEANEVFQRLSRVFEENFKKDGEQFRSYRDWGDHCLYHLWKPVEAIKIYEMGIKKKMPKLTYFQVASNLLNAYFKAKSLELINSNKRIYYNGKGWKLYETLIDELSHEVIVGLTQKQKDQILSELYIVSGKYELALEYFEANSNFGSNGPDSLMFIGLCKHNLKDYSGAVVAFKSSLDISPNPSVRNYLAESLHEDGKLDDAESELLATFSETHNHVDSLLTYISLCIDFGIKTQDHNEDESTSYFFKAKEKIEELTSVKEWQHYSRKLTIHEIGQLYYDHGFIYLQLSKLSTFTRRNHLKSALKALSQVPKGTRLRIKSEAACERISRGLKEKVENNNKRQKALYRLGVISMIIVGLILVFGKPDFQFGVTVDQDILKNRIADVNFNKTKTDSVQLIIQRKTFWSEQQLKTYLEELARPDSVSIELKGVVQNNFPVRLHFKEANMSDALLILLVSVSFVCIVLGLVFNEITSISIGKISIEKSVSEPEARQLDFKMVRSG